MERYFYISYESDKSLRDTKFYETLEEVKKERGITCNEKTLAMARVASYSSPDGSGCYLMDFRSDEEIDFIDTGFASHIMRLMPAALRHVQLEKLGI
jgi:hypothetical protein